MSSQSDGPFGTLDHTLSSIVFPLKSSFHTSFHFGLPQAGETTAGRHNSSSHAVRLKCFIVLCFILSCHKITNKQAKYKRKEAFLFFLFPSGSNFDEVKVTNKQAKYKMKELLFPALEHRWISFGKERRQVWQGES